MNYFLHIPQNKFNNSMTNWLNSNVSLQGVKWKIEIDSWERRCIWFKNEKDRTAFKIYFKLK